MTREEAIRIIESYIPKDEPMNAKDREAFFMAIKSVKQEPCGNAISLQVLEEMNEIMTDIKGDSVYAVRMSDIYTYIRALPSVQPKAKTGKWNVYLVNYNNAFMCDSCHRLVETPSDYCPNCGADMRGEER